MKKILIWSCAFGWVASFVTGCNTANNISQPPDIHENDDKFANVQQTQTGVPQDISKKATSRFSYNEVLSEQVGEMENIERAIVLLDEEHNAYVAVQPNIDFKRKYVRAPYQADPELKITSVDEVPSPVQRDIAQTIRQNDLKVNRIYITDNLQHYQRLQNASVHSQAEVSVQNTTQTTAEQIKEIWGSE